MKIHLNGHLVDECNARISVFDRGFLFGDGVYELIRFFDGYGVGLDAHAARLQRSLALARIEGFDTLTPSAPKNSAACACSAIVVSAVIACELCFFLMSQKIAMRSACSPSVRRRN